MAETGYIKLYRSIQESDIWDTDEPFSKRDAWIYILMNANWIDKTKVVGMSDVTYLRGTLYTSNRILAEKWHWSRDKVRRYLALLERMQMIRVDKTTLGTTINVINYGFYQGDEGSSKTTNKTTNKTTSKTTSKTLLKNSKEYIKNNKKKDKASPSSSWVYEE